MANKYLKQVAGVLIEQAATTTSTGAPNAGEIPALDAAGKLDASLMPVGIAPEADQFTTSENLSAGDFVNCFASSGAKCRKADASTAGKPADGFVLAAVTSGAVALVYRLSQLNNQRSGMTPGAAQFLSASTPGGTTETAPSAAGNVVMFLGTARSATELVFSRNMPITLA